MILIGFVMLLILFPGIPAAIILLTQRLFRYFARQYPAHRTALSVIFVLLAVLLEIGYFVWLLSNVAHFPAQR